MNMSKMHTSELVKHFFLIILCILLFYPFFLMVQMSFKDVGQIIDGLFKIELPFHYENYTVAWRRVSPMIMNSLIISVGTALLSVTASSLAGYAFGRLHFRGKEILFWLIFSVLYLPLALNLIPSFVLAWHLGLLDTYWAVILFNASASLPFWVYVIRIFVQQQSQELFDCAKIDGASELRMFRSVTIPLLKPMITILMIKVFIDVWNDYIWPLVTLTSPSKRPITVGLAYLTSSFPGDYGTLMAGYTLSIIPLFLLFIFGMKHFVNGLTTGAIKM